MGDAVREMTTEEKWERSDVVAIGKVSSANISDDSGGAHATIDVVLPLKGALPTTITIVSEDPVAELSPACCLVGASYLLFLERVPNADVYASVNGPFGVYRVSGASAE